MLGEEGKLGYLSNLKRGEYEQNEQAKHYGVRKKFCQDCGCPIVTDSGSIAGTYPCLFESNEDQQVEHAWRWERHEYLRFRNKSLPDHGLPSKTLTCYLDTPSEFGGSGEII